MTMQIDQMKMSNNVGVLFVDSKQMRSALQKLVEMTIEDIKLVRSLNLFLSSSMYRACALHDALGPAETGGDDD